ncbi:predicted transcriptional regulators [Moorella thermoacetica Y72]|uniref:Predicted transcriptional regulators n=1 Tax=Moorella thermoacetica Y72 TaxID=1325331 RepID=A0A0S6UF95_NEOTH|nr:predicted transcriptional regulators [Moorella thermoacetica Y72]
MIRPGGDEGILGRGNVGGQYTYNPGVSPMHRYGNSDCQAAGSLGNERLSMIFLPSFRRLEPWAEGPIGYFALRLTIDGISVRVYSPDGLHDWHCSCCFI